MIKTLCFTTLALIAFAANSVLCRLALGESSIDAASFTIIRLLSGAATLWMLINLKSILGDKPNSDNKSECGWYGSLMLFIYAFTFSFAYITLDTATGALILFGSVQITMVLINILNGHRLHIAEWLGTTLAFTGFVYLILPGINTPSAIGFLLMSISGIAWGLYTLNVEVRKTL